MTMAALGSTNPEAGVMATRPATAPQTAPTTLGVPLCSQLTVTQVRAAMPAAVLVTTNALAARPFAARAEPPLNPNQPNHRSPAPRAATPELMCTTVPPAKSSAPSLLSQPPWPQTQWAIGE